MAKKRKQKTGKQKLLDKITECINANIEEKENCDLDKECAEIQIEIEMYRIFAKMVEKYIK